MDDLLAQSLRLRDETEEARLDFIWTDLDVILTLATIAETRYNIGNRERAERTLAKSEKGYSDMLRYFSQVRGLTPEIERKFESRFKQVRGRLDGLRRFT